MVTKNGLTVVLSISKAGKHHRVRQQQQQQTHSQTKKNSNDEKISELSDRTLARVRSHRHTVLPHTMNNIVACK